MSAFDHSFAAITGAPGKGDYWLGDIISRIGEDGLAELFVFGFGGLRSDEHPVPPAFVGTFDDEFWNMIENILSILVKHGEEGIDIGEDGLFLKVKLDHFRDEIIHHLVICDAGSNGVC